MLFKKSLEEFYRENLFKPVEHLPANRARLKFCLENARSENDVPNFGRIFGVVVFQQN